MNVRSPKLRKVDERGGDNVKQTSWIKHENKRRKKGKETKEGGRYSSRVKQNRAAFGGGRSVKKGVV